MYINVRENRRGNYEWTIQRHWQHWAQNTEWSQTTQSSHNTDIEKMRNMHSTKKKKKKNKKKKKKKKKEGGGGGGGGGRVNRGVYHVAYYTASQHF